MAENIITQKVGPLPLVVWVAGGAGVIGIFILMSHKGNNGASANATNQVQSLAPTEAEAFGTIEQQQQDVTNALTTLGNNQSALGGSISTLTGIITQQGQDNASAFQNLTNGQQTIEQGQTAASSAQANYQNTLLSTMQNYYASLLNGEQSINSGVSYSASQQQTLYQQMLDAISGVSGQVSGVQGQVAGVSGQVSAAQNAMNQLGSFMGWQFYQIPNRYAAYIPTALNPPGWH